MRLVALEPTLEPTLEHLNGALEHTLEPKHIQITLEPTLEPTLEHDTAFGPNIIC